MRSINSEILTDFVSERGYDHTNKTYFAYVPLEQMACYAAAEGYDNDSEINSAKLAVESVLVAFERKPSFRGIKSYISYANLQLKKSSVKGVLEAAITIIVTDYTRIRYAVCGNIKFYLLCDNGFYTKSEEQTYFQYAAQKYGRDKVPIAENRNLLQYLGKDAPPRAFVSKEINLPEGGTMLLSTCSVWEKLHEIEIVDAYESSEPNEFAANIEELYLGYQATNTTGTTAAIKSYTVATMFVKKTYKEDTAKKRKRRIILLIITGILVAVILISTVIYMVTRANDRNAMAEIDALNADGVRYSNYGNYSRAFEQYESALALVNKLSMKNWQYINEKRLLSAEIKDRWLLFRGIIDGESYMEAGNYVSAQRAYRSVDNIAKGDLELLLSSYLDNKISRAGMYLEIYDDIHLAEIYELAGMYADARLSYSQAYERAKSLGDLTLRKELLLHLLDLDEKDVERATAAETEKERELNSKVQPSIVGAAEAALAGDYQRALDLYNKVLQQYRDGNVQDARYLNILVEIDKIKQKQEQEEQQAQLELELEAQRAQLELEAQKAQDEQQTPLHTEEQQSPLYPLNIEEDRSLEGLE